MKTNKLYYHNFRKIYVEYVNSKSADNFLTWGKANYSCNVSIGNTWEESYLTFTSEEDYFLFLLREQREFN